MPAGSAPSPGSDGAASPRSGIEVRGLTIIAGSGDEERMLLSDVDLSLSPGQRLGLVGASGCGKSLTASAILGLVPGSARVAAGSVEVDGVDMLAGPARQVREIRGGGIGMVLQDATHAFNPVLRVGAQIVETVLCHCDLDRRLARNAAAELLVQVGLEPADDIARSWVHQLSGGQAQRAMLALALAGRPRYLIADEPTTALDLITQRRILDLLAEVVATRGLGLLLISHDLAVVAEMTDHAMVMDAGRVVDRGPVTRLLEAPNHPASRRLAAASRRAVDR